jgi:AraC-like DNA-binding protein
MLETNQISSYIFRFQEAVSPLTVNLNAIGWERKNSDYSYMGLTREDSGGAYLFQYTISGYMMIRIKDQLFRVESGNAFLVPFASDYHYYMPEESDNYECMFISLDGNEAAKCWSYVASQLGAVGQFPEHSPPIRLLKHIYQEADKKKIVDTYKTSMLAYQFIMEMYRYCKGYNIPKVWPDIILKAAKIMDEQFREIDNLDELSSQLGISKFHLIKLFHRTVGKTPIEYLTKRRMEKAVELLRTTDWPLEEISQQIGYMHVNYFSKVFRKFFGVTPGQLRKKYDSYNFMFD